MKAGGANKRPSSSVKDQPAGKRHDAKERAQSAAPVSSEIAGADELVGYLKTDQEFEEEIAEFAKQLELSCLQKLANHAQKLRPNYEEQWILKLKLRLQTLDNKQPGSGPASSKTSASSMKAPPASSHSRKH